MGIDGVTWNVSEPDDSTVANQIDDYMKGMKTAVGARMNREHVWPDTQASTAQGGHHRYLSFQPQGAAPSLVAASTQVGAVYIGTSADGYPLMYEDSAGNTLTLVGSGLKAAVVTGGTQGSILICSSANPQTVVLLAASATGFCLITNSATAAPTWGDHGALAGRTDNDHVQYPVTSNNMKLQVGSTDLANGVSVTVTFPSAFASTPYVTLGKLSADTDALYHGAYITEVSVATCKLRQNVQPSGFSVMWMAIGSS